MGDEEKIESVEQPIDPQARITELENQLAERAKHISDLEDGITTARQELAAVRAGLGDAVNSYKTLIKQTNPDVLAELITGDSIATVNQALQAAKELVGRVKKTIAAEVAATRVPAGAPQRNKPDISGLSAREKIHYGLGK